MSRHAVWFQIPTSIKYVNNLNDEGPGSLRSMLQSSNVIIKPASGLVGSIVLNSPIKVSNIKNIVLDFDSRIELTGWDLAFDSCSNLLIQNCAIRTGDVKIREKYKGKRPTNSVGLDCINFNKCEDVLVRNCSFWSSCDEIVSVVKCKDVHIEYCFLVFPIGGDVLTHPYGDYHAECANCSANEICCFYRCFLGYYRMRGPQFEPNDADPNRKIQMQASNNVMYAFTDAGSRYRAGPEKKTDKVKGTTYEFQYLNNLYVSPQDHPKDPVSQNKKGSAPIVCDTKYGADKSVSICANGNFYWNVPMGIIDRVTIVDNDGKRLSGDFAKQVKPNPTFTLKCVSPIEISNYKQFFDTVLKEAGINDSLDLKAKNKIMRMSPWTRFEKYDQIMKYINS